MPEAGLGARTDRIQCPFQWMRAIGNMVRRRARAGGCPCTVPPLPLQTDEDMPMCLLQPHCLAGKTVHVTMT